MRQTYRQTRPPARLGSVSRLSADDVCANRADGTSNVRLSRGLSGVRGGRVEDASSTNSVEFFFFSLFPRPRSKLSIIVFSPRQRDFFFFFCYLSRPESYANYFACSLECETRSRVRRVGLGSQLGFQNNDNNEKYGEREREENALKCRSLFPTQHYYIIINIVVMTCVPLY